MSEFKRFLLVSTWFQVTWFLAVVGADKWQWLTVAAVLLTLGVSAKYRWLQWRKWGLLCLIGISFDVLNQQIGVFVFESGVENDLGSDFKRSVLPLWLMALWAIFMWYVQFLVPIVSRYPLALVSMMGGISGSLSYWAGSKLDAVTFGYALLPTLGWLFIGWTAVTMLCVRMLKDEKTSRA
ncbi:DUF2878 domain-containing protein [Vibrio renipiscarius]|uniref:Zinc ABC transporter permease n=1 Tax=Vibrio renipiscarius TaxID=1461322 RepID=A0A0C2N7D7_9VIBR|nr:DUF2878 domain-containing protein [Vibrio renipiscarius]KII75556.1 zinc ABC transporter permease [Vibrio renipiscarius]KII81994.1 zinc ABC transporter permease [Vibrio renipiscarius]